MISRHVSRMSRVLYCNAAPGGRRIGHSLLLYWRISGRILIIVAKEEEVFVLNIVVGLEILVRFVVDIVVVV